MTFLGPSKMTSIFGYGMMIVAVLNQAMNEHGMPQTPQEWITFLGYMLAGLGLRFAKDGNVSNSQQPGAAKPVDAPPVNG